MADDRTGKQIHFLTLIWYPIHTSPSAHFACSRTGRFPLRSVRHIPQEIRARRRSNIGYDWFATWKRSSAFRRFKLAFCASLDRALNSANSSVLYLGCGFKFLILYRLCHSFMYFFRPVQFKHLDGRPTFLSKTNFRCLITATEPPNKWTIVYKDTHSSGMTEILWTLPTADYWMKMLFLGA